MAKYIYDAWGNCTSAGETTNNALAHANPIRYRGYYYDDDTGLYYLNARYYSPKWRRFISPATSTIDPSVVNGLNAYVYANNNPISVTSGGLHISGSAFGEIGGVRRGKGTSVNGIANKNDGLSVTIPPINATTLAIDFAASMAGALSVLRWTVKNPTFYEDLLTFGIQKHQMLFGLKTPISMIGYLLLAHEVGADVLSHIRAGDPWQATMSSALVTSGVGALSIWTAGEVGASIGGMIGGVPGFIVGTIGGVLVSAVINGIFYIEINGKSIAGYIKDGIEFVLELLC